MGWDFCKEWKTPEIAAKAAADEMNAEVSQLTPSKRRLWGVCNVPDKGKMLFVAFLEERDELGWGYKVVTEDMGPFANDCPQNVLDVRNACDMNSRFELSVDDMTLKFFQEYSRKKGKHDLPTFLSNLEIFGETVIPAFVDGSTSREEAWKAWTSYVGGKREAAKYFYAIDAVASVT